MGNIFTKDVDQLVGLCRMWSKNRTIDPLTGEEFTNDREHIKYEIACMNILNGAYPVNKLAKNKYLII